ncbi:MAG: pyruvate kinase alpha/beta domain-containing protein [Thermoproteota archaeon]
MLSLVRSRKRMNVRYFEKPSYVEDHAEEVLTLVKEWIKELRIRKVVVASSTGKSAIKAAKILKESGVELIVVSDRAGVTFSPEELYDEWAKKLSEEGIKEYKSGLFWRPEVIEELKKLGIDKILIATELFRGINIPNGVNINSVVAEVLYRISIGVKVCVEITTMACDAGFVEPGEDVIAVAGSGTGLDSAVVIKAAHSDEMFDGEKGFRIKEIICKPI